MARGGLNQAHREPSARIILCPDAAPSPFDAPGCDRADRADRPRHHLHCDYRPQTPAHVARHPLRPAAAETPDPRHPRTGAPGVRGAMDAAMPHPSLACAPPLWEPTYPPRPLLAERIAFLWPVLALRRARHDRRPCPSAQLQTHCARDRRLWAPYDHRPCRDSPGSRGRLFAARGGRPRTGSRRVRASSLGGTLRGRRRASA